MWYKIVLIQEPGSKYVGHVTPKSETAENCANLYHFSNKQIDLSQLVALGCDGAPTNTGPKGGIIRLIEIKLGRPLQ